MRKWILLACLLAGPAMAQQCASNENDKEVFKPCHINASTADVGLETMNHGPVSDSEKAGPGFTATVTCFAHVKTEPLVIFGSDGKAIMTIACP